MSKIASKSNIVHQMAGELMESINSGDKISDELIETVENLIQGHQLFVSLLYVGMVIDQVNQLQFYFDAMDDVVEEVDTKDLAEADPQTKLRAITTFNNAIRSKVDVINSMMSARDAVGLLVSSMKDQFGGNTVNLMEEGEAGKDLMGRLESMKPEQRQKILGGILSMVRSAMPEDVDE